MERSLPARDDFGLADRHGVVAFRHLALRVRAPGHGRLVRIAVEWTVVDALRLEVDHRIVVLDRGDQQALRVVRIRGHHDLEARDMGKQRLRVCECVWPPRMPPPQGVRTVTGA